MYEKLNLSTIRKIIPDFACDFDPRRDIAVYDTLCKYCSEENIDLCEISDIEFRKTCGAIENYIKNCRRNGFQYMAFWFDK